MLSDDEQDSLDSVKAQISGFLDGQLDRAREDRWRIMRLIGILLVPVVVGAVSVVRSNAETEKAVAVLTQRIDETLMPQMMWAKAQAFENYMAAREGRLPEFHDNEEN